MKNKDKLRDLLGNKLSTELIVLLNKRVDIYPLLRSLINVYGTVYTALGYNEQLGPFDTDLMDYIKNKDFNTSSVDRVRKLDRKGDFKWSPIEFIYKGLIDEYPCYLDDIPIGETNLNTSLKLMKEYDMDEDLTVMAIATSCDKFNKIKWIPVIFKDVTY